MAGTHATAEILALSVHGPVGVLDLVVPASATAPDVALEYARQAGLDAVPVLRTRVGAAIAADLPLARAGVAPGDLLVATLPDAPPPPLVEPSRAAPAEHPLAAPSVLWFAVVAGIAVLAGWCAGVAPSEEARQATVALLVVGAVVGVAPVGRFAPHRVLAAPAFAAAAAFVVAWDPHPVRLPMVLGVTGMAAALAGATGRALSTRAEEALRVWIVVGSALFLLTGLGALLGAPPRVVWSLLLVGAVLAARFVPALAVDVPDQYLVDLERLAVTAWSARDRPTGRRGRSVVPLEAVGVVATRGARIVTAAAAAVLVVAAVSAPLLLATARLPIDRVGARCLVGLGGAALLLASRGYRHAAARALLRTAGLACWAALLVTVLPEVSPHAAGWVALAAVLLAVPLVVVAVAAGRGWRSAWWSRRAEVAEGLCGALAVASLVASAGWFRQLWELASLWELGT